MSYTLRKKIQALQKVYFRRSGMAAVGTEVSYMSLSNDLNENCCLTNFQSKWLS